MQQVNVLQDIRGGDLLGVYSSPEAYLRVAERIMRERYALENETTRTTHGPFDFANVFFDSGGCFYRPPTARGWILAFSSTCVTLDY